MATLIPKQINTLLTDIIRRRNWAAVLVLVHLCVPAYCAEPFVPQTVVSIQDGNFFINGAITMRHCAFQGHSLEGLLPNARLVQAIFDDLNPQTRSRWNYPDGSPFSAERNTREFLAALPTYRAQGLLAFTINLQGGNPEGYRRDQPWINSRFAPDGAFRPDYVHRAEQIIQEADRLGMVVILGLFYAAQEAHLDDETAVLRAVDNATDWLTAQGYTNVLVEIANECDIRGFHPIIQPSRVGELIRRVQERSAGKPSLSATPSRRLLVSTSLTGNKVPGDELAAACDFILLHGNGVNGPNRIREMIAQTRALPSYRQQPIVFNEDDHYAFDQADNNLLAAFLAHASWGYYDYRMNQEPFACGFQSVPVDWRISSPRKQDFFRLLRQLSME